MPTSHGSKVWYQSFHRLQEYPGGKVTVEVVKEDKTSFGDLADFSILFTSLSLFSIPVSLFPLLSPPFIHLKHQGKVSVDLAEVAWR